MAIDRIQQGLPALEKLSTDHKARKSAPKESFADMMKNFLQEVNQLQKEAGDHVEALLSGETVDLHDVMIAVEKASVSFELVMEVRNKLLEAYQELLRTQV